MMNTKSFCVFILTHGRPDSVVTYSSLLRQGYTGKVYFVVDNEDKTADKYIENFGKERVLIFDKLAVSKTFDTADNFNDRRAIVYARNICFQLSKKLDIDFFIQLDDDYTRFQYRFDNKYRYNYKSVSNLDKVFDILVNFYKETSIGSVAIAQGGDFIGGAGNNNTKCITLKRKCMNTFVCSHKRPFTFLGAINEDVNTYTRMASTGLILFTFNMLSIVQKQTQSNSGGMTDIYLDGGTYKKSFYTVIFQPSSVKVSMMGDKHMRLHHAVKWNNTVPKILRENIKYG